MSADHSPSDLHVDTSCYFSIVVPSTHFSIETPSTTPLSEYSAHTFAEPSNPLLAWRLGPVTPSESMSNAGDASRLLQLQTAAAHSAPRPIAEPLQARGSMSSTDSSAASGSPASSSSSSSSSSLSSSRSNSVVSPATISCCRCRRESLMGMIQFGTNIHYCSHCARMVGYSAG